MDNKSAVALNQNVEPQKLAPFLRERCENGRYGLKYVDQQKRFIYIPWPIVPRANEILPPGFQMFQEWAMLSFLKRNQEAPGPEKEQPTIQKHRFRNALARADGIKYRKDLNSDGGRIYEFIDSKARNQANSPYTNSDVSTQQGHDVSQPLFYQPEQPYNTQQFGTVGHTENYLQNGFHQNNTVPINSENTLYPQPDMSPVYPQNCTTPGSSQALYPNNYLKISPRYEESNSAWNGMSPQNQEVFDLTFDEEFMKLVDSPLDPDSEESHSNSPEPLRERKSSRLEQNTNLVVKLRFQNREVFHCYVTNEVGCRIFYGDNVIDRSQLLEPHHRDSLMRFCRHDPQMLFGPDILEQVRLPCPQEYISHSTQLKKSQEILNNMERGLILSIAHHPENHQIPDIYAMRLCQTRIFPFTETPNGNITLNSTSESLTRMKWTKVFDAKQFIQKSQNDILLSQTSHINPTFSLSLGQRTSNKRSGILVSLQVTVQAAQDYMVDMLGASISQELCISGVTSMDLEARKLASEVNGRITLST